MALRTARRLVVRGRPQAPERIRAASERRRKGGSDKRRNRWTERDSPQSEGDLLKGGTSEDRRDGCSHDGRVNGDLCR